MPRIRPGEYEEEVFDEVPQRQFVPSRAPAPDFLGAMQNQVTLLTKELIRQNRLLQILSDGDEYKKAVEQFEAEERAKSGLDPRVDGLEKTVNNLANQFGQFLDNLPRIIGNAVAQNLEQFGSLPMTATEVAEQVSPVPKPQIGQRRKSAPVPEVMKAAPVASSDNGKSTVVGDGMEREIH